MPRPIRLTMTFCLLLFLAGCVGFTLAKGGENLDLGEGMPVQPTQDWNRIAVGKYEYWTLEGLRLQHVFVIKSIADGERLTPSNLAYHRQDEKDTFPKFRKGMSLLEVRELYEATLAREKAQNVKVTKFSPARFGGRKGFRFSFTFQNQGGLEMLGTAAGAIVNDKLYMMVYRGTKLHFFALHEREFENILKSLSLGEAAGTS